MLDERDFEKWMIKYKAAKADLNDREKAVMRCMEELEQDMELLGVTGVEGIWFLICILMQISSKMMQQQRQKA